MTRLSTFIRDERGGPAAEMALALPMVMALLFGGMEGANFFWREHQVVKAARDAARFASRQRIDGYDCAGGTIDDTKVDLARITAIANADLVGTATVGVTVACAEDSAAGLYLNQANGAPVVTVTVQLPYQGLFSTMVLDSDLVLNARSQSAVLGI